MTRWLLWQHIYKYALYNNESDRIGRHLSHSKHACAIIHKYASYSKYIPHTDFWCVQIVERKAKKYESKSICSNHWIYYWGKSIFHVLLLISDLCVGAEAPLVSRKEKKIFVKVIKNRKWNQNRKIYYLFGFPSLMRRVSSLLRNHEFCHAVCLYDDNIKYIHMYI